MEQQDHRVFAAHSSLGWSAGERGRFEIKKSFLECKNAVPTTEPQVLKGTGAAASPGKVPSVIKTNPPPTQKLAAKAKAPALTKTQAESRHSWQPWCNTASVANAKVPAPPKTQAQSWRGAVSVLMAAFLIALVAMSGSAFGLVDATSLASAGGAQPALYINTTRDVVACPAGIYLDPISDMADDQSSVLSAGDALLHSEAVCSELGVRGDAGGPMTDAVHANMLRPSAPGLCGFRLLNRHQSATDGLPCPLLASPLSASPLGWHVQVTAVHALLEAPSATICNNDSGMSSSLAATKEANLLAGSAKESASLAEQVTTTAHMEQRHFCSISAPAHWAPTLPQLHAAPLT